MSSQRIEADSRGVYTSGVRLTGHTPFTEQTFRTAFATFKHLVRPGESLTGEQWASRIELVQGANAAVVMASTKVIRAVMGGM